MADDVARIPVEVFARDVAGFIDRVLETGAELEVVGKRGTVTLTRHAPGQADAAVGNGTPEAWQVATDLSRIAPPTPERIARHHEALRRARELRDERLDRRGGTPTPSNAELINHLREERSRELAERSRNADSND